LKERSAGRCLEEEDDVLIAAWLTERPAAVGGLGFRLFPMPSCGLASLTERVVPHHSTPL